MNFRLGTGAERKAALLWGGSTADSAGGVGGAFGVVTSLAIAASERIAALNAAQSSSQPTSLNIIPRFDSGAQGGGVAERNPPDTEF